MFTVQRSASAIKRDATVREMLAARASLYAVPAMGPAIPLTRLTDDEADIVLQAEVFCRASGLEPATYSIVVFPIIRVEGVQ